MTTSRRPLPLHWKIVISLILAVITGLLLPKEIAGYHPSIGFNFFGDLFLRALQMLVAPLIALAIVSAVARMGEDQAFGRLGLKTMGFYIGSTTVAVIIGLLCSNLIQPGKVSPEISEMMLAGVREDTSELSAKFEGRGAADLIGIFQRMIPLNVVEAASNNSDMLAVIFFSLLFGYFISQLPGERRERYSRWWEDGYEVMLRMTNWVVRFTPYGVFALVAATVTETGLAALLPLGKFFFTVVLALAIHMFIALPLALRLAGLNGYKHIRSVSPALFTAFSTASSAAALPLNIECSQKNSGVSKSVTNFTLPIGATVNMDGTALYECSVVIFIAQLYGVDLSLGTQVLVVLLSLFTSLGVAGIPAASLVAIVVILGAVGLPKEAIGIVMAVDRILDMCRTTVNIYGDSCCAAFIAKTEGEALPNISIKP